MSIYSYILTILEIVFWVFRIIITVLSTNDVSFIIQPLNTNLEIALIFVTIPCMILVLKRNVIGAAFYMALYVSYFGTAIYNSLNGIIDPNFSNVNDSLNLAISIVGVVIPVLTFIDVLFNKNRKAIIVGRSSTDWYYENEEYDRKYDDRADKNQYKIK
jgi:Mn2+/Fe2+ NRAMP family transporter